MATDFTIRQNDTGVALQVTCYSVERDQVVVGTTTPTDLTGGSATFTMKKGPTTVIDHQPATIVDSVGGIVKYVWSASDTSSAGRRHGWFRITFADGTKVSFPNDDDPITIQIVGA
jgi:hypothetical protein